MSKYSALFCILLLLFSLSQPVLAQPDPGFNPKVIDDYLEQQVAANHLPGLAVAVVAGDQVVFSKGYGELSTGRPVTGQTQFYIGSLTKTLTALAVMQLVEQGKIDLDAPVQRYLPWFTLADPQLAAEITIRHLLNQTSGLAEVSDPGISDFNYAPSTSEQVRGMADARLMAAPGVKYQYYNGNYQILGLVIEQVSGKPYDTYMRDHIFTPFAMSHTVTNPQSAPDLAQGHGIAFGLPFPRSQAFRPAGLPSGYLISTAEDLAHVMIVELNQGRYGSEQMIQPETLALTQTPPAETGSTYGMGWVAFTDAQFGRVLYHDGALENYNAQMILLPDRHSGLVALTNQGGLLRQLTFNPLVTSGMADTLGGYQPKAISYAWIGWVLLGILLLDLANHLFQFWRLPRWSSKIAARSRRRQWLHALLAFLIPFLLLTGILLVLGGMSGGLSAMTMLPDLAAWVLIGLALAVARGAAKVFLIWRANSRQRRI